MSDGLNINTNFFANNGAIGRRDFAVNIVILTVFVLILSLPANIYVTTNILNINNAIKINTIFFNSPLWIIALYMLSAAFQIVIGISNAKRRITDIYGKENDIFKYIFSFIIILKALSICFSFPQCIIIEFIYYVILVYLICKKGKITSQLPYDATKLFNFGAFFGGWLWGVINKVFYPLWQLILIFTPFSLAFSLFCGLKGNEWALKAKNYENIEDFNSKQETQGIIFSIISLIVIPSLIFIIYTVGIVYLVTSVPQEKMLSAVNKIENYYLENAFEKCIFDKENICYVRNDYWKSCSYKEKTDTMEMVAKIAEDKKNSTLDSNDYANKTTKMTELKKTKIYSENGEQLLAEFNIDDDFLEGNDIVKTIKAVSTAYKFYPMLK